MKGDQTVRFWDEKVECMDRKGMEKLQTERLRSLIQRVHAAVPFHQKRFAEHGIKPEDIKSLKDLSRLPFTFHRRLRPPLWSRAAGCLGHTRIQRKYGKTDHDYEGLQDHNPGLYPFLRPSYCRGYEGYEYPSQ